MTSVETEKLSPSRYFIRYEGSYRDSPALVRIEIISKQPRKQISLHALALQALRRAEFQEVSAAE
jgi:hypothetical protein